MTDKIILNYLDNAAITLREAGMKVQRTGLVLFALCLLLLLSSLNFISVDEVWSIAGFTIKLPNAFVFIFGAWLIVGLHYFFYR